MRTLAIILSRAGSKGLRKKAILPLCGRPVITYTIDHARRAKSVDRICLTTDSIETAEIARRRGVEVIDRPAALATDTAPVDLAIRHALIEYESRHDYHADAIVLLYGNVPVRKEGVIDRGIAHLVRTGADSVRTVAPVSKHHPDWLHRLDGDAMRQFRPNKIHRRQELEPLYYHDGALVVLTRSALFREPTDPSDHLSFFGQDCRAIVQAPEDTVDIDSLTDFYYAEAILRQRSEAVFGDPASYGRAAPTGTRTRQVRPVLTGAVSVGPVGRR